MTSEDFDEINHFQTNIHRLNEESIQDWYRFPFAYSDKIVTDFINEFKINPDDLVCDPFNGTGTTTLSCKKHGIDSIGVDASPVSVLASRVKANLDVGIDDFKQEKTRLLEKIKPIFCQIAKEDSDSNFSHSVKKLPQEYELEEPSQLLDGWISKKPMLKMLALKHEVSSIEPQEVQEIFQLAMISILPEEASNIAFGPTPYKKEPKEDAEIYENLRKKLNTIEADLKNIQNLISTNQLKPGRSEIFRHDAREIGGCLKTKSDLLNSPKHEGEVDYVITSPPYPNERDYTRIQRLELIWLDELHSNDDLQEIKKSYIRSNTKNIYVGDSDGEQTDILEIPEVKRIVDEMHDIIDEENIEHGFGLYYPRVVEEYFGGMCRHLQEMYDLMAPGGKLAYVVGDQHTYWQIKIETGDILGKIAERKAGFKRIEMRNWRKRWTPNHNKDLPEEILILSKPGVD